MLYLLNDKNELLYIFYDKIFNQFTFRNLSNDFQYKAKYIKNINENTCYIISENNFLIIVKRIMSIFLTEILYENVKSIKYNTIKTIDNVILDFKFQFEYTLINNKIIDNENGKIIFNIHDGDDVKISYKSLLIKRNNKLIILYRNSKYEIKLDDEISSYVIIGKTLICCYKNGKLGIIQNIKYSKNLKYLTIDNETKFNLKFVF